MNELIGIDNSRLVKLYLLGYHLPEFYESLTKYIHYVKISEEKLKSIKIINITFYDEWFETYLPLMQKLEIVYISFGGVIENFSNLYNKLGNLIPIGVKVLILRNHTIDYFIDLFNNPPVTLQKIIILEKKGKRNIITDKIKNKFKYIPFGCKVFYCYDFDESGQFNKHEKTIELTL